MIAASGALVLVAAVLLVAGLFSSITLVYAAISLSIVSVLLLLAGLVHHPGRTPPAAEAQPQQPAPFPLEAADPDVEVRSAATGADVFVVSGRPRYHVARCKYVDGRDDAEPLEISEARELGFTPCGVCRPNETVAG